MGSTTCCQSVNMLSNILSSGAKVKDIHEQLSIFQEEHKDSQVKNIIIHVGTNHLPRDKLKTKENLKRYVNYWCVYNISFSTKLFSIPEYYQNLEKKSFGDTNYINELVFSLCARSQRMHFISQNSFAVNGSLNGSLFWKDRIHTNKRGLQQLVFNFIKYIRHCRF